MRIRRERLTASIAVAVMTISTVSAVRAQQEAAEANAGIASGPLARTVRAATAAFRDVGAAEAAGYVLSSGCVSGPERGAMGVHYVNAPLVGDGLLVAEQPEALVYEPRRGRLELVAVEYIVMAEQWDANNDHPPVLNGQHFHYVPAPNRSGLDAYYELHVWAWKQNPHGTFADWNPRVRCDDYNPR